MLSILVLTRFLHANRSSPRIKSGQAVARKRSGRGELIRYRLAEGPLAAIRIAGVAAIFTSTSLTGLRVQACVT
jgi:hypothetical protein